MRIVIQDPETNAYFDGTKWGATLPDAMDFENTNAAEKFCAEHCFNGALVVVKFKDETCDFRFPATTTKADAEKSGR